MASTYTHQTAAVISTWIFGVILWLNMLLYMWMNVWLWSEFMLSPKTTYPPSIVFSTNSTSQVLTFWIGVINTRILNSRVWKCMITFFIPVQQALWNQNISWTIISRRKINTLLLQRATATALLNCETRCVSRSWWWCAHGYRGVICHIDGVTVGQETYHF